jgi:hypothetical protein
VLGIDVVWSEGIVDEDLKQSTKHHCEGDGTGRCCCERILGRFRNKRNNTLAPARGRPGDSRSKANEKEEVMAKRK